MDRHLYTMQPCASSRQCAGSCYGRGHRLAARTTPARQPKTLHLALGHSGTLIFKPYFDTSRRQFPTHVLMQWS